jgi:hypothetical protein
MHRHFLIGLLLAGASFAQNGIFVDKPKVYDDYYLQSQLDSLKARLAAINAADQTTLLGKIGGLQGATMQQSGFAVQGLGPATPTVTASLPPAGVAPSSSNGVTTATTPLTPAVPTPPAPSLTAPSTFSPSSLDTLNEEMQLSAQIINLQLLLDGALNDRFIPGSQQSKRHVTVGFSVNIEPPADKKKELANSLAEVEITLKNPPDLATGTENPSVITLLPKEKTYNVASLVDKSVSIGAGGVIGGVFNVGAGWLWGKKTYYLVQQQDTIAVQRAASDTHTSDFAWQFRPVLGSKFVATGSRQMFVQFSVPVGSPMKCSAQIHVRTGWRKLDPKTGLVSQALVEANTPPDFDIPFFDLTPTAQVVEVNDVGGGMVSVSVLGGYIQGLRFRVGTTTFDQTSPNFWFNGQRIDFVAPAKDLAAYGVIAVGRDGSENQLFNGQAPQNLPPCSAPQHPAPATQTPGPVSRVPFTATITASPFSDTQSLVTLNLSNIPADFSDFTKGVSKNPVIVIIGDQVFGLRNTPFRSTSGNSITLLVSTDLLKTNRNVRSGQLLWGEAYMATATILPDAFPSAKFSINGASIVSTAEPQTIAITGSGLKGTQLVKPEVKDSTCMSLDSKADTLIYLTIQKACVDKFKQIVLSNDDNSPVLLTVPTAKSDAAAAKPSLKPQDAIAPNTSKITITGTGLDQISAIRFGKTRLSFTLSLKKDSVTVVLTPDVAANEGVQYLDVTFADGTKSRYELNVKKPS